MQDETAVESQPKHTSKIRKFARKHPVATSVGVGGLGLIGGPEVAVGMLIGAGVLAVLRRDGGADGERRERTVRERSRNFVDRVPRIVRDRARAIVDAARGKSMSATEEQASTNA